MVISAVIFDMDGLLIDSEPLWQEATHEVLQPFNVKLTTKEYETTTGLRTKEFIDHWFRHFDLPYYQQPEAVADIVEKVRMKILQRGMIMPGVPYIIDYFLKKDCKIGVATSSPRILADAVVQMLGIDKVVSAVATAEDLDYGKPHPQVYLNCAAQLNVAPQDCLCFEDSFNGLIAAKAAKMKCVVVPAVHQLQDARWGAADLKISSLQNFNDILLQHLK
jgi:sugar-phosphatase